MLDWKVSFRDYALNPDAYWPIERKNQLDKLQKRLRADALSSSQTVEQLVDQIIDVAAQRIAVGRPPTIFLISCGSSGSHWLEAMMAEFSNYRACGETYLPKDLIKDSYRWDPEARGCFLDCVHLLHAPGEKAELADARLINSAHTSGWTLCQLMGSPKASILLLRNPVDIVVSRTFRKDEYRQLSAPSATDEAYLDANIEFVQRFYALAAQRGADQTVRYEDLRTNGENTLGELMRVLQDPQDAPRVRAVIEQTSVDAAGTRSGSPSGNYFRGPRIAPPQDVLDRIRDRLAANCAAFGY